MSTHSGFDGVTRHAWLKAQEVRRKKCPGRRRTCAASPPGGSTCGADGRSGRRRRPSGGGSGGSAYARGRYVGCCCFHVGGLEEGCRG